MSHRAAVAQKRTRVWENITRLVGGDPHNPVLDPKDHPEFDRLMDSFEELSAQLETNDAAADDETVSVRDQMDALDAEDPADEAPGRLMRGHIRHADEFIDEPPLDPALDAAPPTRRSVIPLMDDTAPLDSWRQIIRDLGERLDYAPFVAAGICRAGEYGYEAFLRYATVSECRQALQCLQPLEGELLARERRDDEHEANEAMRNRPPTQDELDEVDEIVREANARAEYARSTAGRLETIETVLTQIREELRKR